MFWVLTTSKTSRSYKAATLYLLTTSYQNLSLRGQSLLRGLFVPSWRAADTNYDYFGIINLNGHTTGFSIHCLRIYFKNCWAGWPSVVDSGSVSSKDWLLLPSKVSFFFLLILPEVRLHLPYSSDPDFSKLQGHLPLYPTPCWLGWYHILIIMNVAFLSCNEDCVLAINKVLIIYGYIIRNV